VTRRFALVASVLLLSIAVRGTAAESPFAPKLQLMDPDGTPTSLAALRGRVVLVDFWASWCAPCKASFPLLDAIHRDLHEKGVDVLAINVDERRRDMDAFLADRTHAMPVLVDPRGIAAKAFSVQAMPTSFILDRLGRIRFTHTGYTASTIQRYREEIAVLLAEH